jgi:hypothetical protein
MSSNLGAIKPYHCPYAEECGYHGIWLYEQEFREHLREFHKGREEKLLSSDDNHQGILRAYQINIFSHKIHLV